MPRKSSPRSLHPAPPVRAQLVAAAYAVGRLRPWETLDDVQIIAVDIAGAERCYLAVLGALGEVLAVQAYLGQHGLAAWELLQRSAAGGAGVDPGALMASYFELNRSLMVDYVVAAELNPLDRAWLDPRPKGVQRWPQFRSWHPGYLGQKLDGAEMELLLELLRAFQAWWPLGAGHREEDVWEHGQLPLVRSEAAGFAVELIAQQRAAFVRPPLTLPEDRRQALAALPRSKQQVELDCFFVGPIGKARGRQAAGLVSLMVDAKTGFVFEPGVGEIGERPPGAVAALLGNTLFEGILQTGARPARITVRTRDLAAQIEAVAGELGIALAVRRELPALDLIWESMGQHLLARQE